MNGCRRLVHVSSFVVYQLPFEGEVTENSARAKSGTGYAHTKGELEAVLLRAVREDGLPGTILQPPIVYGPLSRPWTIEPADMLRHGTVILPDRGEGICDAVYVDDAVSAMILAAQHPRAVGQRFLISGPRPITWRQFYEEMARAAGANGPQYRPADAIAREGGKARKPLRLAADPEGVSRRLAQNRLCRKLLQAGLVALPQDLQESVQNRLFGPNARRRGFVHMPNLGHLRFLQSRATIGSGKARREPGYAPQFDFAAGMVRPLSAGRLREEGEHRRSGPGSVTRGGDPPPSVSRVGDAPLFRPRPPEPEGVQGCSPLLRPCCSNRPTARPVARRALETIVVDGASVARTAAVVLRLAERDHRVQLLRLSVDGGP